MTGALLAGLLAAGCAQSTPAVSALPSPTRRSAASLGPTDPPRPTLPGSTAPAPAATHLPIPTVGPDEHIRGPLTAPTTLLLYSDFDCQACARLAGLLAQLQRRHPQELRLVFRHFPWASLHDKAALAGELAELAAEQGSFWPMYDRLVQDYPAWSRLSREGFLAWAIEQAEDLGLDGQSIQTGLAQGRHAAEMERAFQQGMAQGVPGAPFLLIDGEPYLLPQEANYLEAAVRLSALRLRQFTEYPSLAIDPQAGYLARLQLDRGELLLQLYPQYAPLAVNSFVFLAEQGWFDGNPIYQVRPGVFLETGDPSATGLGDPGYHFGMEPSSALRFDRPGMVALVPTSPETNGGRFFITLAPLPELDGARTIFGRVLQGMELLLSLPARDPLIDLLQPPPAVLLQVAVEIQR